MKILFRFFNFILIIILIAIFAGFILSYLQIFSSVPRGKEISVNIQEGSSTTEIANLLQTKGIVKSGFIFKWLANYTESSNHLQAGEYTLNSGMSMLEVLDKLKKGGIIYCSLTVPEGYDLRQIARLLDQKGIGKGDEFLELAKNGVPAGVDFKYSKFLNGRTLEGFLFPDTYDFPNNVTSLDIVKKMLHRFEEVLPPNFDSLSMKRKMNPYRIIVMASLIEREAQVNEERPLISAVYYNRLKKGINLQCDATIQYLFETPKEFLSYSDLEIESPYNTYIHKGLPPGPIANPGIASIKAALNPGKVSYLYYVVKGDGKHKFSNTYEEHLNAVEEYRKKLDE